MQSVKCFNINFFSYLVSNALYFSHQFLKKVTHINGSNYWLLIKIIIFIYDYDQQLHFNAVSLACNIHKAL